MFDKLKSDTAPSTPEIRVLCPSRWTVRAQSLKSIIDNYEVLLDLWDDCLDVVKEAEVRSRIIGVQAQMSNFSFYWVINLGELLLRHADNLSKTLQNPKLSAASGQEITSKTVETLQHIRNERDFHLFYDMVLKHKEHLGDRVAQPKLPRKRNVPRHFQIGATSPEHPAPAKDQHRMEYFLALDHLVNSITQRFQQNGYEMYRNLQDVIVKACN